ncbi:LysR family transcriptional regulator [Vibrio sp. AND4]|uniref:LysR family transcriptional regulator n=1 Tax=Vibrio sp. AND4 TaxID=314289 RepID=UPI00015F34F6|nr:LysR family transcriptional regulator [Vibrio sp. AND4]EDP59524.1 transcriptional regulator, LysR family protein [Vibrio sp. AND4]
MEYSIDLNLYRFLHLIFEQKSMVKVCQALEITRAAFYLRLADCRKLFGNQLFITREELYLPTLFCRQLMNTIEQPLKHLESAQAQVNSIDAHRQTTQLSFFVPNPLSVIFTNSLLELLDNNETITDFSVLDRSLENIELTESGTLSVGVSGYPSELSESVLERKIGKLGLYLYTSKSNPLWHQDQIDIQALQNEKLVRISMGAIDDEIYGGKAGFTLSSRIMVPSVTTALDWLTNTNYVLACFALPDSVLPHNIKKIPLTQDSTQMFVDIGLQFHKDCLQHPIITKLEKCLSDTLLDL